mmetsp:Transcript_15940/g.23446  ORF Transcript_15940/g.23446 Transcript_15940/m.23446 type:complete len:236 (+) Transcript_15940:846-1553(+)
MKARNTPGKAMSPRPRMENPGDTRLGNISLKGSCRFLTAALRKGRLRLRPTARTGLEAAFWATSTMTFCPKMRSEKKTQKMSYTNRDTRQMVATFRLLSRSTEMMVMHKDTPIRSVNIQWPVNSQPSTTTTASSGAMKFWSSSTIPSQQVGGLSPRRRRLVRRRSRASMGAALKATAQKETNITYSTRATWRCWKRRYNVISEMLAMTGIKAAARQVSAGTSSLNCESCCTSIDR